VIRHVDAHLARLAQNLAMLAMLRGCCPDHTVDAQLHEGTYVELDPGALSLNELEVVVDEDTVTITYESPDGTVEVRYAITSRDRRGSV
jgi:hypothetical protein